MPQARKVFFFGTKVLSSACLALSLSLSFVRPNRTRYRSRYILEVGANLLWIWMSKTPQITTKDQSFFALIRVIRSGMLCHPFRSRIDHRARLLIKISMFSFPLSPFSPPSDRLLHRCFLVFAFTGSNQCMRLLFFAFAVADLSQQEHHDTHTQIFDALLSFHTYMRIDWTCLLYNSLLNAFFPFFDTYRYIYIFQLSRVFNEIYDERKSEDVCLYRMWWWSIHVTQRAPDRVPFTVYVLRAPMRVNRALVGKVMMMVLLRKTGSRSLFLFCLSARSESDEIIDRKSVV